MKKNEKQLIAILGVAIAVVAIALIAMLITSRDTPSKSDTSLKDAVQEEANSKNEGEDVSQEDTGNSVVEEDATDSEDNTTTTQEKKQTTTEASNKKKSASQIMDADDGYIFPNADTAYLSKSEIKKLSDSELQYAVNEIYARNGLKFTKKENKERFEKKKWYTGTVDDQDSISLNKYEKKNIDVMAAELKKRGLR